MLIRILEIPPCTGNFHFASGEPQIFIEVDWFRDDDFKLPDDKWESLLTAFLQKKNYYRSDRAYLVLHPERSFTINYRAP